MCFGVSARGLVQRIIRSTPSAEEFSSLCDKFSTLRDKLRHPYFFTREADVTSDIVDFSPRGNRLRFNSQKCCVTPIGYVLLEICVRGPQFRKMIAVNLAAFTSASAWRNGRPSQSE
jgi:hypothetical protein